MYINFLNNYLRDRFGHKLYKAALDGGMSCPNRDGTAGTGGCVFCLEGSGAFAQKRAGTVAEQLAAAKDRIKQKAPDCGLIAYYQSYTNTYAPIGYLDRLFRETIECAEVEVLSIATRPDCLPEETVALLKELNGIKPVWVELGLQTSNEKTAEFINRGYKLDTYDQAVKKLNDAGIETITHIIFGLPGETREDMLGTVKHIAKLYRSEKIRLEGEGKRPLAGIKLQLMHILKGTALYDIYTKGEIRPLERDEYIGLVCDALELLPCDIVIHRMTGDGDKRSLAAPLWSADKKGVRAAMDRAFAERDVTQGRFAKICC